MSTSPNRTRRRSSALASLVAALLLVAVQAPPAAAVSITVGGSSILVNDLDGGLRDFTVDGNDDLFEVIYFYRAGGMTQEAPIAGSGATSAVTSVSQTAPDTITVLGSVSEFDYQIDYVLSDGALQLDLSLDETNGTPLTVSLFSYQDWDLGGGADDLLTWDGSVMELSDGVENRQVLIAATTSPDATEGAAYDALRASLEDTSVTNLTDGAGLPFGPGDATLAFQYDLAVAANGSESVSQQFSAVPEPGTAALTALGLLPLCAARRRRVRRS